jgi:tetratricopeptide (TPR) repeat protein
MKARIFQLFFIFTAIVSLQAHTMGSALFANEKTPLVITQFKPRVQNLSDLRHEKQKICLLMTLTEENPFISNCLQSAKEIADCFCIYDSGANENNVQVVNYFMETNNLPGVIYQQQLDDPEDKTDLFRNAQRLVQGVGFSLSNTYFLIVDPDMKINKEWKFDKENLFADAYLVADLSLDSCYKEYKVNLLRASLPWENSGALHEHWSYAGMPPAEILPTLSLFSTADGKDKKNRLAESAERLLHAVQEDYPRNQHYIFPLAHAYLCLKQYDQAIHWFQILEKGKDREDVWYAKYMLGECYEALNEWDRALHYYFEAFQYSPNHTEPLRKIATHYRLNAQPDLAYIFAKHGSRIPYSGHRFLIDAFFFQNYQFNEELSIISYYTRFKNEGLIASNDLILEKNVPYYIKMQTYRNMLFYLSHLKTTQIRPILIDLPLIQESDEHYHPMNPSIQKTDDGYELICRSVNYTQTGAKVFKTVDPTGVFRTRNFLVTYDRSFNMLSQKEIVENLPRPRVHSFNIAGLEDCRLAGFRDASWFTCNTNDTNPYNHQISLCKLGDKTGSSQINVEKLIPLKGPDPYRCEKNWLPFIKENDLHIIYSFDPFILYKPDIETGDCPTEIYYEPTYDFTNFRGSAAPIEFDGGYLVMVHEVVFYQSYERVYLHRFLYLDRDFQIQKLSLPFTFLHEGVEYCCSMTIDHSGTELVIPIGIEDREAHLCFVSLDTVRSLLQPLPVKQFSSQN